MKMSKRIQRRILLLLDITAFFLSFMLGYLVRYHNFRPWGKFKLQNDGIYPVILVVCVLLYIMLYFYRNSRHSADKNIPLAAQDPLDIIVSVLKTQFFVFLSLLIFLFAVHKASFPSRMVLGSVFLSAMVLDGIFHILFAKYMRRMLQKHPVTRNILLVTGAADAMHVIHRLQYSDGTLRIKAILLTDRQALQKKWPGSR
jgi:FlaA1/EpsC-like NDP-sugar epimerase